METLDLTLPTPEENLACDEALLRLSERDGSGEVLRFWEPRRHFIVLGLSNSHRTEIRFRDARTREIPVLRRCSGGGAVLQGPGCLNFALVLRIQHPSPLEKISASNHFILERHRGTLEKLLGRPVSIQGCTDLTLGSMKFSGNSQRRGRDWLLFHGTFLLRFDLDLIESLLEFPSRPPAYRRGRSHSRFLTNLPLSSEQIKQALREAWGANGTAAAAPTEEIAQLLESRYSRPDWNLRVIVS
jgi:lipoate-protein ligase A